MDDNNSPKIFIRHFIIFYIEVAVIHTFTYIIFGIIFSNFLDYSTIYSNSIVSNFMRGFESPLTIIGPFLQPIRSIFIAIALYPMRKIIATRFGWFILWLIFVCIGIISSPAAAPSSIEGIIYTQLPIEFHLINLPELLLQTLSFSIILWIAELLPHREKEFSNRVFLLKIFFSILLTMIGIFLTSVSGIILMNFLELDFANAKLDRGTVSYLTAISILTIIVSYAFGDKVCKNRLWLLLTIPMLLLIYIGFPYGYNYLFNTVYNTEMALVPYGLSSVIVCIVYYFIFAVLYRKIRCRNKIDNSNDEGISDDTKPAELTDSENSNKYNEYNADDTENKNNIENTDNTDNNNSN